MKPMAEPHKISIERLERDIVEALKKMSPEKRLCAMFDLIEFLMEAVRAGVVFQHPDWSEEDVRRETAKRVHRRII